MMSNMKAVELVNRRFPVAEDAAASIVIWQVPRSVSGSTHSYKYRLAYVVDEVCVLRYDNEAGKGDHRHWGKVETAYRFVNTDRLLKDFLKDIARWNHENRNS